MAALIKAQKAQQKHWKSRREARGKYNRSSGKAEEKYGESLREAQEKQKRSSGKVTEEHKKSTGKVQEKDYAHKPENDGKRTAPAL